MTSMARSACTTEAVVAWPTPSAPPSTWRPALQAIVIMIHAKTALVVRKEGDVLRRYVHLGSGNYNSRTARMYTDVGLLTHEPWSDARSSQPIGTVAKRPYW